MITAFVRRSVCRLNFNSSLPKSHYAFSLSLLQFSTSNGRKSVVNPTVFDFLLHKHHFSPEAASQIASVLTRIRNPEKSDSVLFFLNKIGFSKTQVEKMVKSCPDLLSAKLEKTIKPKIRILQEWGISADDVVKIISNDPSILKRSLDKRLIPALSDLRNLLGSNSELVRLLKASGYFLKNDLKITFIPNVEFLKSCSISMEQITWIMYYFLRFLFCKPENMKKLVEKVDQMGVSRSSKRFIHAVRVRGSFSDEAWERKLTAFRNSGFSEDDLLAAFRNSPMVFGVSEKKIKEVQEFFLASNKYNMSCIVNDPVSFTYSVKKRYKPRFQVLETLESKKIIQKWPCFEYLGRMSEKRFYEKFVGPYLDEVGDLYLAKSPLNGKPDLEKNFTSLKYMD